jgi:hypothetical protein
VGNLKNLKPHTNYQITNLQNYQVRIQHHARDCHVAVRRVQRAELLDHEEQEDHHGTAGVQQVLQALPEAYGAQGSEVSDWQIAIGN